MDQMQAFEKRFLTANSEWVANITSRGTLWLKLTDAPELVQSNVLPGVREAAAEIYSKWLLAPRLSPTITVLARTDEGVDRRQVAMLMDFEESVLNNTLLQTIESDEAVALIVAADGRAVIGPRSLIKRVNASLGNGDDTVDLRSLRCRAVIDGGEGDDVILIGNSGGLLIGGAGDDTLICGRGETILSGDEGRDIAKHRGNATFFAVERDVIY